MCYTRAQIVWYSCLVYLPTFLLPVCSSLLEFLFLYVCGYNQRAYMIYIYIYLYSSPISPVWTTPNLCTVQRQLQAVPWPRNLDPARPRGTGQGGYNYAAMQCPPRANPVHLWADQFVRRIISTASALPRPAMELSKLTDKLRWGPLCVLSAPLSCT